MSILGAYTATVERSAETETPQQKRGEVLQQSVKKLIARPIDCIISCVNGVHLSAAETALYETKKRSKNIKYNSTATHFCKTSIAEKASESSAHRRRFTHRYPTSAEIVIACRSPVFVWQLGVRLNLRVSELLRALLGLLTMRCAWYVHAYLLSPSRPTPSVMHSTSIQQIEIGRAHV